MNISPDLSYNIRTAAMKEGFTASDVMSGFVFSNGGTPIYIPADTSLLKNRDQLTEYLRDWTDDETAQKLVSIVADKAADIPDEKEDKEYLEDTFHQAYIVQREDTMMLYSYGVPVMQVTNGKPQLLMDDLTQAAGRHIQKFADVYHIDINGIRSSRLDMVSIKDDFTGKDNGREQRQ